MDGGCGPGSTRAVGGALRDRLRPLAPGDRDVLMRAAAVGREFDVDLVSQIALGGEERIREVFRRACRLQLVEPVEGCDDRFRFRHALTRDAVYGALVCEQLRPLHRDIGVALERLGRRRATAVEELAYHWWAAGDARRGVRYNEDAGDRASAVHAVAEALIHYGRALDLASRRSTARRRIRTKIARLAAATAAFEPDALR